MSSAFTGANNNDSGASENIDKPDATVMESPLVEASEPAVEDNGTENNESQEQIQEENSETETEETGETPSIGLELGDVVDIFAPLNEVLHKKRFYIDYIDEDKIILINIQTFKRDQINIDSNGVIDNNSITSIELVSRDERKGYARQNNLLPGVWVNIYFGGDTPAIITGEITNLEEDMIEVTAYPSSRVIYIPFNYRGIPQDIPIERFEIRRKPESAEEEELETVQEPLEPSEPFAPIEPVKKSWNILDDILGNDSASSIDSDEMRQIKSRMDAADEEGEEDSYDMPDARILSTQAQEKVDRSIQGDHIVFGDINAPIINYVEVDAKYKRYNIEVQTNDMMDGMLSTIPTSKQTPTVLNDIHTIIERYTQLREKFSVFNKNGVINRPTVKSHLYKPLKEVLAKGNSKLYWVMKVAKNEKKIYTKEEVVLVDNDIPDVSRLSFFENMVEMDTIIEESKSTPISNDRNTYVELYNSLNPFFVPFNNSNLQMDDNQDVILQQTVQHDMPVLIDNYDNFYSTTFKEDTLGRKRFMLQQCNTGITHLENTVHTGAVMDSDVGYLTPSDKISIKSILTLPVPAIQFSKINLPNTNILVSSQLNQSFMNYWQLLKTNTQIRSINVHLTEEESASALLNNANKHAKEEQGYKDYFDTINHYALKTRNAEDKTREQLYEEYLDKVVPTIRNVFNIMAKYIHGKVSLVNIIDALEPFMIYTDDLTYKQYQLIIAFIDCKISKFNKMLLENKRDFNTLKYIHSKKMVSGVNNTKIVYDSFGLNRNAAVAVIEEYEFERNKTKTVSEMIKNMYLYDYGAAYYNACALSNVHLKYPSHIAELLVAENASQKRNKEADAAKDKCVNYTIAKKYRVKTEIDADNGVSIYYDKEFDNTPYGILDDYVSERNRKNNADFEEFLIEKLKSKEKFSEADAIQHAKSMVTGMKKVRDGDYAVFFNSVNNQFEFYIRENNVWSLDEKASKEMFKGDQNAMCNFQNDCLYSAQKVNGLCESLDVNKDNLQLKSMTSIIDQFDKQYDTSKQEQMKELQRVFDYNVRMIRKRIEIQQRDYLKNTVANYDLGIKLVDDVDAVVSPYSKYLDFIMGQQDLGQKYDNIVSFVRLCTRPPNLPNEDGNFFYCNKTDVPLVPIFLFTLANAFLVSPDNYRDTLNEVIRSNGVVSEEGDRIIDKYSGKFIAFTDFSAEEGFDEEGFRIQSREVEEADWGEVQASSANATAEKAAMSPETQLIYKIVNALSIAAGISIPGQMEFIVRNVKNTVNTILPTEEEHNARNEALEKKGKPTSSYEDMKNTLYLYLTFGMFIIAVQTNIPTVRTRKTYPGCSSSLEGYPLRQGNDLSFIQYIACIAYKIRVNMSPWNVLLKKKEEYISTTIYNYIESYLSQIQEVTQKIKSKYDYLQEVEMGLNRLDILEERFSIKRMTTFLPPQVPFKMTHLNPVPPHFNQSLLDHLRDGSYKQEDQLAMLQGNIIRFSYAVQEEIQKVITEVITKNAKKQNKFNLLISLGGRLALENACCNDDEGKNFLQYFKNKNANIEQYNYVVNTYANILRDIKFYTNSCIISSKVNTKNIFPPLDIAYSRETIYRAFIHYCKFNSIKPVPDELIRFCKEKPLNLDKSDTIETQISKLKTDGREYSNEDVIQLLLAISKKNVVNVGADANVPLPIRQLRECITGAQTQVIPNAFTSHLMELIDHYSQQTVDSHIHHEDNELVDKLRDYLITSNKNMKKQIIQFIKLHGKVSKVQLERTTQFLNSIMDWGGQSTRKLAQTPNSDVHNSLHFIKTYLTNFINIFPNVILKQNTYTTMKVAIPKHWNISPYDASKISNLIIEYYTQLHSFYGNESLTNVLKNVTEKLHILMELANKSPVATNIMVGNKEKGRNEPDTDSATMNLFDTKTGLHLFEFYFLQTIQGYILACNTALAPMSSNRPNDATNFVNEATRDASRRDEVFEDAQYAEYTEEINKGQLKGIKHNVATLLCAYLDLMENHKIMVNISYDFIMGSVFKIQQSEKETFTSKLEKMSIESRQVDKMLKMHKLGDWNVGLQKGLTTYDKNASDDDIRRNNENYQQLERRLFANKNVTVQNMEQYAEDALEEDLALQNENDEYNMQDMGEDYFDGDPHGEENEDY